MIKPTAHEQATSFVSYILRLNWRLAGRYVAGSFLISVSVGFPISANYSTNKINLRFLTGQGTLVHTIFHPTAPVFPYTPPHTVKMPCLHRWMEPHP